MKLKTRSGLTALSALALAFLLAACGAGELETVQSLRSGPYQIDVLAPGGTFKSGDNSVGVRVLQDGQPVDIQDAQLVFSMPAMGAMPAMQTQASLSTGQTGRLAGEAEGTVTFSMGGGWNGRVQATTPSGPVGGTFNVQVEE